MINENMINENSIKLYLLEEKTIGSWGALEILPNQFL